MSTRVENYSLAAAKTRLGYVCFQPKVHVNYDFEPRTADELGIRRGEVITVTDMTDADWWEGLVERDNVLHTGHFPVSYVTLI